MTSPPAIGQDVGVHRTRAPWRRRALPYLLVTPLLVGLLVFTYFPILSGVWLSLTNATFGGSDNRFIGLGNYQEVLSDRRFWQTFYQTAFWTVFSVAGAVVVGVAAALAMERRGRGTGLMRVVTLLPWIAPPVVIAYIWRYLLSPTGPISPYLASLGLTGTAPDLLNSTSSYLGISLPLAVLTLFGIWSGVPFVFIFTLGALSVISPEIKEAGLVDGTSPAQAFRWLIWPLIRPVVATAAVLLALVRFGALDLPFLLTGGGPGDASSVFGVLIYNTAFTSLRAGIASTMGVVVFLLVLPAAIFYVRRSMKSATG